MFAAGAIETISGKQNVLSTFCTQVKVNPVFQTLYFLPDFFVSPCSIGY